MNIDSFFPNAKKIAIACTQPQELKDLFFDKNIVKYFDISYVGKYYSSATKKGQRYSAHHEMYNLIHSKDDVINYFNFTEEKISGYRTKLNSHTGSNTKPLEYAVDDIENIFSRYIIALRKLMTMNPKYSPEYESSFDETKIFVIKSFEYEEKISQIRMNIFMM